MNQEKQAKKKQRTEEKNQQRENKSIAAESHRQKNKEKIKEGELIKLFKKLNTKRNRIIVIILAVIIVALIVNSMFKTRSERMSVFDVAPTYVTATVGEIAISVAGDGNLGTGTSISFFAETEMAIEDVAVQEGQTVKAGDVLATLDAEEMSDYLAAVFYELNDMQATVDASYIVEDTYYIKAPVSGRLKSIQVEEEDMVEDAMETVGYIALISTVDEMKILVTEEEYKILEKESSLVIRSEGHKHDEDIELREIVGSYYVILPNSYRTIGAEANIYSASATKEGNELATGTLELISYEKVMGTYGMISYQDDYENYTVEKGEVLFHVDQYKHTLENAYMQLAKLREEYELCKILSKTLTLVAPHDGIITEMALSDDGIIAQNSLIAKIQSEDDWVATVAVDELDINDIAVGQTAMVMIDAIDDGDFSAVVQSISSAGISSSGITTYDVVLSVKDDSAFKIAMNLSCEIAVESIEDAILVPSTVIRTMGNRQYVMVASERTTSEQNDIKQAILKNDYQILLQYMDTVQSADRIVSEAGTERIENIDMSNLPDDMMAENMQMTGANRQIGGMNMMISNSVELIYGEIVFVEIGLEDGTYTQIVSGVKEGESILTPISSDSDAEESTQMNMGMMGMGVGGGGGGEPPQQGSERGRPD